MRTIEVSRAVIKNLFLATSLLAGGFLTSSVLAQEYVLDPNWPQPLPEGIEWSEDPYIFMQQMQAYRREQNAQAAWAARFAPDESESRKVAKTKVVPVEKKEESVVYTAEYTFSELDVDGDGTVGTAELARAAELYQDSKNMVKRLAKAVAVLFLVMVALVGTIVGLTAHVIESAKETETSGDGITYVKGSDQPTATGRVTSYDTLGESYAFSPEALDDVDTAYLFSDDESEEFSYTITGWSRNVSHLIFYTSRGDTITVDTVGNLITHDDAGNVLLEKEGGSGRRLLRRGKASTIRRGGGNLRGASNFVFGAANFQGNF